MYPLIIPRKILLPLAIICFVMMVTGGFFKISHQDFFGISSNIVLGIGTGALLFVWFIVVADALRNRAKNPFMWIIAFLFFGNVASILYLFYRDQIIIKKEKNNF